MSLEVNGSLCVDRAVHGQAARNMYEEVAVDVLLDSGRVKIIHKIKEQ